MKKRTLNPPYRPSWIYATDAQLAYMRRLLQALAAYPWRPKGYYTIDLRQTNILKSEASAWIDLAKRTLEHLRSEEERRAHTKSPSQNPRKWMPLSAISRYLPEMKRLGVSKVARSPRGFLTAYKRAGGQPARMSEYWRRRRAAFIARHLAQYKKNREKKGGRRWLALAAWAYAANPKRGR